MNDSIDDELRKSFQLEDQGNWNQFIWADVIDLGSIHSGDHSIMFETEGQQYSTADLDKFILTDYIP